MNAKREAFFDMPMMFSLLILCGIMLFIFYAGNKRKSMDATFLQRDSVEVVISDKYNLTFSE